MSARRDDNGVADGVSHDVAAVWYCDPDGGYPLVKEAGAVLTQSILILGAAPAAWAVPTVNPLFLMAEPTQPNIFKPTGVASTGTISAPGSKG
jgi:hypothetical protein